jgi:hypothetical protein
MLQAFQNYKQQYSIACLRIQTEKSWQPDGTAGLPFNRRRHPDLPRVTPEHGKSFNQASGVRNVSFMRQAPKNETAAAAMIR